MMNRPPRIARWLLMRMLPGGNARDGLLGDLDELYTERARTNRWSADYWYARQVLSAILHYLPLRSRQRGRGVGMLDALTRDVGYTVRMLRRRPGFTITVVLTLALGIGANTAVFSVVRSVLLRPLPFPEDERLAVVLLRAPRFNMVDFNSSPPEYVVYRDHIRSWERLSAVRVREATITEPGYEPDRIDVAFATWNLVPALGVPPMLGRSFAADEDQEGTDDVAVLSHAFWTSRYGSDPQVIGRTVLLNGIRRTIIGVMPAEFRFPSPDVRFWVPLALGPADLQQRGNHSLTIVGRLRSGVTFGSVEDEIAALWARHTFEGLPTMHQWHPGYLRQLRTDIVGDVSQTLWVMLGAVVLVLMIACANVANLLLIRAEERGREMTLRRALGAGQGRIGMQLMTESLVLAVTGGTAGVAVAFLGVTVLRRVAPPDLPRLEEIVIDPTILAFATILTVGSGLLFGMVPVLHGRRADLHRALRDEGRSGMAGRKRIRARQVLVVSETALAVMLLIAAGLLLQSFRQLMKVDPGFGTEHVLTTSLTIPSLQYDDAQEVVGFYESLLSRIGSLPGVAAIGAASKAPLAGGLNATDIEVAEWVNPGDAPRPIGDVQVATPGYFDAMSIPVIEGRAFQRQDGPNAPLVAMVSESLARLYWPERTAIGGHIRLDWDDQPFAEVIGIVPDVHYNVLGHPPLRGVLYLAHAQTPRTAGSTREMTVTIRTSIEPSSLIAAIRAEVRAIDASVPVYDVRTMEQAVDDATATQRFSMLLQLLFALVALALAAVGLYGALAYTVVLRQGELGIRMALGARRSAVRFMVVRHGMGMVVVALAVGVAGAVVGGRLLGSLLFGVSSRDPVTYVAVVGVLGVVGLVASWIPALRASGVDPIQAMRAE